MLVDETVSGAGKSEKDGMPPGTAVQVLAPAGQPRSGDAAAAIQRLARAHAVPDVLLAALEGPLGDAIAKAAEYAGSALSAATRRAYARDWAHFANWCRDQAAGPGVLPVHPVLVAAYLTSLAGTIGRSALNGRLAAIAHEHRRRGIAWNAGHPAIRETLQGIARTHGKPVRPAAALTSTEIKRLLASCRDDLAGLRDRALFLVGFAGALRRSELVAIDHHHLRFETGGVTIHIPRSKRDQEGKGAEITLPRMRDVDGGVSATCPVQALERWLSKARIRRGAVFRSISAGGRLGDRQHRLHLGRQPIEALALMWSSTQAQLCGVADYVGSALLLQVETTTLRHQPCQIAQHNHDSPRRVSRRGARSCDVVFVRSAAPYRSFAGSSSISTLVRRALARAGIQNPPSHGANLLRHSAATSMLRAGATLDTIGTVLRHQSATTTAHYAKVDVPMLLQVAQPWPGEAPC